MKKCCSRRKVKNPLKTLKKKEEAERDEEEKKEEKKTLLGRKNLIDIILR